MEGQGRFLFDFGDVFVLRIREVKSRTLVSSERNPTLFGLADSSAVNCPVSGGLGAPSSENVSANLSEPRTAGLMMRIL